jgi:hypothetical protein
MRSLITKGLALVILSGCASMDSERRFTGVVEKSQKITRAGESSGALMGFGALGGLLHHATSSPTVTNFYRVRVGGETFSAQADEAYPLGACVDIIPSKGALTGRDYAYGQARLQASDKCTDEAKR